MRKMREEGRRGEEREVRREREERLPCDSTISRDSFCFSKETNSARKRLVREGEREREGEGGRERERERERDRERERERERERFLS